MGDELMGTDVEEDFHAIMDEIKCEEEKIAEEINSSENYQVHTLVQALESHKNQSLPSLCRLCATRAKDMVHMFGTSEQHKNIIEKIERCLPVVVKSTDKLPKYACQMCLAKLELCFQFHKAVAEAEKQLLLFDQQQLLMFDPQQILIFDQQTPSIIVEERTEFCQTSQLSNGQQDTVMRDDSDEEKLKTLSDEHMNQNESTASCEVLAIIKPVIISNLEPNSKGLSSSGNLQTNNQSKENRRSSNGELNEIAVLSTVVLNSGQISISDLEQGTHSPEEEQSNSTSYSQEIVRTENHPVSADEEVSLISDQQTERVVDKHGECYEINSLSNGQHSPVKQRDCNKKGLKTSSHKNANNDESIADDEGLEVTYESVKKKIRSNIKPRPKVIPSSKICGTNSPEKDNEASNLKKANNKNRETKSIDTKDENTDSSVDAIESMSESKKGLKSDGKSAVCYNYDPPITRSRRINMTKTLGMEDGVKNVQREKLRMTFPMHECDECKEKFATKLRLKYHKLHHEYIAKLRVPKNYDDFIGQEKSSNDTGLTENKENKRSTLKSRRKMFRTREELFAHQTELERTFNCTSCKRKFNSANTFEAHKKKRCFPRPDKNISCSYCRATFSWKQNLDTHIRRRHTKESPYGCDLCDQKFVTAQARSVHRRTHTGESPYKCTVCNKTFAWAVSLRLHTLSHTGERPYSCPICNKAFRRLDAKQRHMITHTEEKLHECDKCSLKFREACFLRRHKKVAHGNIVVKNKNQNRSIKKRKKTAHGNTAVKNKDQDHTVDK